MAPNVWTRVAGTPARIRGLVGPAKDVAPAHGGWSIAEHVGHLGDLDKLALRRLDDFDAGVPVLHAADMTNRATYEAGHRAHTLKALTSHFEGLRNQVAQRTAAMSLDEWARAAIHPRLGITMRVIDLMEFMSEHDDHHLAEIRWLLGQRVPGLTASSRSR